MFDQIIQYFTFLIEMEFKIVVGILIVAGVVGSLYVLTNFFRDRSQSRRKKAKKEYNELKRELEAERKERAELQRRMDEQYARLTILMDDQRKETAALEKTEAEEV